MIFSADSVCMGDETSTSAHLRTKQGQPFPNATPFCPRHFPAYGDVALLPILPPFLSFSNQARRPAREPTDTNLPRHPSPPPACPCRAAGHALEGRRAQPRHDSRDKKAVDPNTASYCIRVCLLIKSSLFTVVHGVCVKVTKTSTVAQQKTD